MIEVQSRKCVLMMGTRTIDFVGNYEFWRTFSDDGLYIPKWQIIARRQITLLLSQFHLLNIQIECERVRIFGRWFYDKSLLMKLYFNLIVLYLSRVAFLYPIIEGGLPPTSCWSVIDLNFLIRSQHRMKTTATLIKTCFHHNTWKPNEKYNAQTINARSFASFTLLCYVCCLLCYIPHLTHTGKSYTRFVAVLLSCVCQFTR